MRAHHRRGYLIFRLSQLAQLCIHRLCLISAFLLLVPNAPASCPRIYSSPLHNTSRGTHRSYEPFNKSLTSSVFLGPSKLILLTFLDRVAFIKIFDHTCQAAIVHMIRISLSFANPHGVLLTGVIHPAPAAPGSSRQGALFGGEEQFRKSVRTTGGGNAGEEIM